MPTPPKPPKDKVSALGYALLGLIREEPRTGYALRMVFETTPMGNYSSSPGSIYPALKSLQKLGFTEPRLVARKALVALTPVGEAALDAWLAEPVTADHFARHMAVLLLRFALLKDHPDPQLTLDFLRSFEAAGQAAVAGLKAFIASDLCRSMPLQARLAVDYGLRDAETATQWAADAHAHIQGEIRT